MAMRQDAACEGRDGLLVLGCVWRMDAGLTSRELEDFLARWVDGVIAWLAMPLLTYSA